MLNPQPAKNFGETMVRAGFAFEPAQDRLFALGWPHLRHLDDAPLDDQAAVEAARRVLLPLDSAPRILWNHRLASGIFRALAVPAVFEMGPEEKTLRVKTEEALWNPTPVTAEEVAAGIALRMTNSPLGISDRMMETWVLLAEALVGTAVVAESIVETLEQLPASLLSSRWTLPTFITYQLGYLLLRLPVEAAEGLRARLATLLARAGGDPGRSRASWEDGYTHLRSVHLVLSGAEAAKRGADRNLSWYTHVVDDPNFLRMRVAMDRLGYRPDARLVFLGGTEVLQSYARRWQRMDSEDQRWFYDQIAPIASPHTATIMLEMSGASSVRALASRWFAEHRGFALPLLKQAAETDGTSANQARALLKSLGS